MNTVSLPAWLSRYIYQELGGYYRPDFSWASENADNTHADNIRYAGTYMVRTYAEVQRITQQIDDRTLFFKINQPSVVRVMSVGCGTGGDITGLVQALSTIYPNAEFRLVLADANIDAIGICREMLNRARCDGELRVEIEAIEQIKNCKKITSEKFSSSGVSCSSTHHGTHF